eukprot:6191243-Pleurochrysis_carterae.AAC.2
MSCGGYNRHCQSHSESSKVCAKQIFALTVYVRATSQAYLDIQSTAKQACASSRPRSMRRDGRDAGTELSVRDCCDMRAFSAPPSSGWATGARAVTSVRTRAARSSADSIECSCGELVTCA